MFSVLISYSLENECDDNKFGAHFQKVKDTSMNNIREVFNAISKKFDLPDDDGLLAGSYIELESKIYSTLRHGNENRISFEHNYNWYHFKIESV